MYIFRKAENSRPRRHIVTNPSTPKKGTKRRYHGCQKAPAKRKPQHAHTTVWWAVRTVQKRAGRSVQLGLCKKAAVAALRAGNQSATKQQHASKATAADCGAIACEFAQFHTRPSTRSLQQRSLHVLAERYLEPGGSPYGQQNIIIARIAKITIPSVSEIVFVRISENRNCQHCEISNCWHFGNYIASISNKPRCQHYGKL